MCYFVFPLSLYEKLSFITSSPAFVIATIFMLAVLINNCGLKYIFKHLFFICRYSAVKRLCISLIYFLDYLKIDVWKFFLKLIFNFGVTPASVLGAILSLVLRRPCNSEWTIPSDNACPKQPSAIYLVQRFQWCKFLMVWKYFHSFHIYIVIPLIIFYRENIIVSW